MFFSYSITEDEMQISKMPIPADDCANSEMPVQVNPTGTKSDLEPAAKVNGENHKKLNGSSIDDIKEAEEVSEAVVKKDVDVKDNEEDEPKNKTESVSESTDELVINGECEKQDSDKNIEVSKKEKVSTVENDKPIVEPIDSEEEKPMEIDEVKDQLTDDIVIVKKELDKSEESKPGVKENEVIKETDRLEDKLLNNGEVNHNDVVIKNDVVETNSVNGDARLSDEEKSTKSEKVSQKIPVEEDVSSEMSTEALSPKQVKINFKFNYLLI